MKSTPIQNCLSYDFSTSFSSSTLLCTTCNVGYFLTTKGICQRRENISERCLSYNTILDECLICDDIYYLNSLKTECDPFPKGIYGCVSYENHDICL